MYTSTIGLFNIDQNFVDEVEPLLLDNKVRFLSCILVLLVSLPMKLVVSGLHIECVLFGNLKQVDLALFGHVHNYERTCSIYDGECKGMPTKDKNGIDVYDHSNYTAPVQAVIGMAGFKLDKFNVNSLPLFISLYIKLFHVLFLYNFQFEFALHFQLQNSWSLSRISEFGYFRGHATKEELKLEVSLLNLSFS